jgi:hypothetical protein
MFRAQSHSHISPGKWTIGPMVAAVQRHRLTPSTWATNIHFTITFPSTFWPTPRRNPTPMWYFVTLPFNGERLCYFPSQFPRTTTLGCPRPLIQHLPSTSGGRRFRPKRQYVRHRHWHWCCFRISLAATFTCPQDPTTCHHICCCALPPSALASS